MSAPVVFADLGKTANDLLTKDFPSDKGERVAEFKGTTAGGIKLTSKVVTKQDGASTGTFIGENTFADFANVAAKLELSTERVCKSSFEVKDKLAKGLKTKYESDAAHGKGVKHTFNVTYNHAAAAATSSLTLNKGQVETKAAVVVGLGHNFSLGAEVEYHPSEAPALRTVATRLAYTTDDFDLNLTGKMDQADEADKHLVGLTYHHKISPTWQVAADVNYDVASSDAKPVFKVGTAWQQSSETLYKARVDTTGQLALGLKQKYSDNVSFSLGYAFDVANLDSKSSSKLGFSLNVSD